MLNSADCAHNLPGGWLRWAEAAMHPRLDWRGLLAAKVRSSAAAVCGAVDYSYARPPLGGGFPVWSCHLCGARCLALL